MHVLACNKGGVGDLTTCKKCAGDEHAQLKLGLESKEENLLDMQLYSYNLQVG